MSQISTKEQIIKFKDYADIADASYVMLHWIVNMVEFMCLIKNLLKR